jgi:hypothetical protein
LTLPAANGPVAVMHSCRTAAYRHDSWQEVYMRQAAINAAGRPTHWQDHQQLYVHAAVAGQLPTLQVWQGVRSQVPTVTTPSTPALHVFWSVVICLLQTRPCAMLQWLVSKQCPAGGVNVAVDCTPGTCSPATVPPTVHRSRAAGVLPATERCSLQSEGTAAQSCSSWQIMPARLPTLPFLLARMRPLINSQLVGVRCSVLLQNVNQASATAAALVLALLVSVKVRTLATHLLQAPHGVSIQ